MCNIMTLEDFFTLTEMKDGLTVPLHVEELVAEMRKEKDNHVKSFGDAVRHWSNVASVLAVTENKECLDLFIQLDGLLFINKWLKDAQTVSADSNDSLIEELILTLLQALEKLKVDNEKLTSSEIYLTVRDLLSHKSINVQVKAKAVHGNLKPSNVREAVQLDPQEAQAVCDDRTEPGNRLAGETDAPISSSAISPGQKSDVDRHMHQLVGENTASVGCCDNLQSGVGGVAVKESDKLASNSSESDNKEVKDKVESSVREEASASEQKSMSASPEREQGTDLRREVTGLGSPPVVVNAEIHNESFPNNLGKVELSPAFIMPNPETSVNLAKDYVLDNHVDSSTVKSMSVDLPMGGTSTAADETGVLMNCTVTLAQKPPSQCDESCSKTLQDSLVDENKLGKSQDLGNTYPQTDNISSVDKVVEHVKHISTPFRDYEDKFSSSPKKNSRDSALHLTGNPDSFNGEKDQPTDSSPLHKPPVVEKISVEDEEPAMNADDLDAEQENGMEVTESSQVTDTAPETANKGIPGIDLNLKICSEAPEEPASPHRTFDGERTILVDLNLAEDGGDEIIDTVSFKQNLTLHTLHGAPSGESLVESSERRSEKLSFDLNQMSEDGDASISPSLKPTMRNLDLNNRPSNFIDLTDPHPYMGMSYSHKVNTYGGPSDDSVISIMGAKVKKNTFVHQSPISFLNGWRASETGGDANLARSEPRLAPTPIYSYSNGIPVGPTKSFSPLMYGPGGSTAYMVDSRGASIFPQLTVTPTSNLQASFAHQSTFNTNVVGPPPGLNGASSSRSHLDFNPGFVVQGRSADVQLQSFFPGIVGGKRKEPEGGWEFRQPPHL